MVDDDLFPFWEKRDRNGFIQYAIAKKKTERGNKPNKQTASRWYGLIENIAHTAGDYWIHRDGDEIWWITFSNGLMEKILTARFAFSGSRVFPGQIKIKTVPRFDGQRFILKQKTF